MNSATHRSAAADGWVVAEGILHPAVLGALGVLVANDHWGKARHPGVVTGKVSDVAGLMVFPWLLAAAAAGVGPVRRRVGDRDVLRWSAVATSVGFAAVKASADVAWAWSVGLGWLRWPVRVALALVAGRPTPRAAPLVVRADPTDLLAVPVAMALVAAIVHRSGARARHP